jgi:hypothetical protein
MDTMPVMDVGMGADPGRGLFVPRSRPPSWLDDPTTEGSTTDDSATQESTGSPGSLVELATE